MTNSKVPGSLPALLPFSAIELYHLADDSRRFPNVISCDLIVRGSLDPDVAQKAIETTSGRHLLSCARVLKRRFRRPAWLVDPSHVADPGLLLSGEHSLYIDLNEKASGRLVVLPEGDRTRLSFQIHHAASDGAGGLQIVIDWLLTYHQVLSGSNRELTRSVDHGLLARRNDLRLFSREFLSRLWIQPIAVFGATKFLFRRVTPIVPEVEMPVDCQQPVPVGEITVELDENEVERIRLEARQLNATINELVLRAVFLAIHGTRKRFGWHQKGEWLRLVIPMNIRDFADRRLPAANRATIVQIDRRDRDFADPEGLLGGVGRELGNIRDWNLEKTFLLVLKWMSLVPGWIRRSALKPVCRATSVVTNLGMPFDRVRLPTDEAGNLKAGNLVVEDIELKVPLRPKTPLGFAVVRYGNRQKINIRFDSGVVPTEVAREIATRVRQILVEGPPQE
jgi:hypothetical protein